MPLDEVCCYTGYVFTLIYLIIVIIVRTLASIPLLVYGKKNIVS